MLLDQAFAILFNIIFLIYYDVDIYIFVIVNNNI